MSGHMIVPDFLLGRKTQTKSFTVLADDHWTFKTDANYQVAHDAANADECWLTEGWNTVGQIYPAPDVGGYRIGRTLLYYDTSALPDDANILYADIRMFVREKDVAEDFDVVVVDGSGLDPACNLSNYGLLLPRTQSLGSINTSEFTVPQLVIIDLNDLAMALISKIGITVFGVRSSHDINSTPLQSDNYIAFDGYEWSSPSRLVITYLG